MQEWKPHPKQLKALKSIAFETLFGGARGGGKTDTGQVWLLDWYKDEKGKWKNYIEHPRYRALVLRKNSNDLRDWLDRASYMYKRYGAEVKGNPAVVQFPSGAKFLTGHLKDRSSYEKYLGHEYQRILLEELTQIPREIYYIQILGSCRSTIEELKPGVFATTNPGGNGHLWVKRRFIDVAPPNTYFKYSEKLSIGGKFQEVERSRIFIPSSIDDNPVLVEKDPGYVLYLESLKNTDPDLYRAWRHGDWDVFAGQFFGEFRRDLHVQRVSEYTINHPNNIHLGGIDWGYTANTVILFSVLERVTMPFTGVTFNRIHTYKELVGNKKTPIKWSEDIRKHPYLNKIVALYCDPAMFNAQTDGGKSIKQQFDTALKDVKVTFRKGSNDRIGGWSNMHNWLSIAPDGLPYWVIDPSCLYLLETLPSQVHDEHKVEDIDTTGEDHAVDTARYMLSAVKWIDGAKGGAIYETRSNYMKNVQSEFVNNMDLKQWEVSGKRKR